MRDDDPKVDEGFAKLKINIGPAGYGDVWLNGTLISDHISGVTLKVLSGELTEVTLKLVANVEAEIETSILQVSKDKMPPDGHSRGVQKVKVGVD